MEKAREFQKNIYFCFTDYAKAFDYVDLSILWKIYERVGNTTPPNLASWEICMQVRNQQLELDMEQQTVFQIGKGVHQDCIFSPCLFNLYA